MNYHRCTHTLAFVVSVFSSSAMGYLLVQCMCVFCVGTWSFHYLRIPVGTVPVAPGVVATAVATNTGCIYYVQPVA